MPVLPVDSMPDPLPADPKLEAQPPHPPPSEVLVDANPFSTPATVATAKPSADPKPSVAHESVPAPSKFVAPVLPTDAAKKASTLPPPPFPKSDDKK